LAAWLSLLVIVGLTVVPPELRPTTAAPHDIEHAVTFLGAGGLFGIAYAGRELVLSSGAVVFCAVMELLQIYVPGRHARIIDLVVDAAAAIGGIFLASFAHRIVGRIAKP
jgi:VanZ family protein